jgi:hypothetical protein
MRVWLLDDGPFGILAQEFDPGWSWPPSVIHLVGEVARAASRDRSGRRQALLSLASAGALCVEVHHVLAGTPAADDLYTHLRPSSAAATHDLGEHVSIAFCAIERPDAIFVTQDKAAAYLALAELGPGRVSTPFDFWDEMRAEGLISHLHFEQLCRRTLASGSSLTGLPLRLVPARF